VTEELQLTVRGRDATVITIAELCPPATADGLDPLVRVVEHYAWVGRKHAGLYPQIAGLLKDTWCCSRVVIDATGVGEAVASFLRRALGSRIVPFKFTQASKSVLGFNLLAAVNAGRLKIYAPDGSDEYRELMFELDRARGVYRPNQTLNFFVDPNEGHDDYLVSLALCLEAASGLSPRKAVGSIREL
jgi:hypothetical protein